MKRYTSPFLKSVAAVYLAFPVFYVCATTILFDIPGKTWFGVLLHPYFYLLGAAAMVAGWALWEMKRWAWHFFIGTNVLIAYETAVFVHDYGRNSHKALAYLSALAALILVIIRLGREIRVPYFFPRIRWWESDPRYRLAVPVSMASDTTALEGMILDLSIGGCFVKMREDLKIDEPITIRFSVFGFVVSCEGVVVWATQSTVTHPKGVGIKFTDIDRLSRRSLRSITRKLKAIAAYYKRSRHLLTPEEFAKGLKELEAKGTQQQ